MCQLESRVFWKYQLPQSKLHHWTLNDIVTYWTAIKYSVSRLLVFYQIYENSLVNSPHQVNCWKKKITYFFANMCQGNIGVQACIIGNNLRFRCRLKTIVCIEKSHRHWPTLYLSTIKRKIHNVCFYSIAASIFKFIFLQFFKHRESFLVNKKELKLKEKLLIINNYLNSIKDALNITKESG